MISSKLVPSFLLLFLFIVSTDDCSRICSSRSTFQPTRKAVRHALEDVLETSFPSIAFTGVQDASCRDTHLLVARAIDVGATPGCSGMAFPIGCEPAQEME